MSRRTALMPNGPRGSRMAYYAELSQVGIEMAAPIGIGALIDRWGEWTFPICSTIGAVVGLVGGIFHLVILSRREDKIADDDEIADRSKGPP